jgi:HAMP domain-containing protein
MKKLRVHIGLRTLLLLVALFAVIFAWIGTQQELQRLGIKAELDDQEYIRKHLMTAPIVPGMEAVRRARIEAVEAEISKQRELLGMQPTK